LRHGVFVFVHGAADNGIIAKSGKKQGNRRIRRYARFRKVTQITVVTAYKNIVFGLLKGFVLRNGKNSFAGLLGRADEIFKIVFFF
jgi:hypothetical protein